MECQFTYPPTRTKCKEKAEFVVEGMKFLCPEHLPVYLAHALEENGNVRMMVRAYIDERRYARIFAVDTPVGSRAEIVTYEQLRINILDEDTLDSISRLDLWGRIDMTGEDGHMLIIRTE